LVAVVMQSAAFDYAALAIAAAVRDVAAALVEFRGCAGAAERSRHRAGARAHAAIVRSRDLDTCGLRGGALGAVARGLNRCALGENAVAAAARFRRILLNACGHGEGQRRNNKELLHGNLLKIAISKACENSAALACAI
jgi:hypothetical protein